MKTAVITGATKGIGKAIAEKFLANGFSIATCARTKSDLEQAQHEWQEKFPESKIHIFEVDLQDTQKTKNWGEQLNLLFPKGIDVLINNAGLFHPGNLIDEPNNRLESLMAVHVFSAYHLCRKLTPGMIKNRRGHIFNMLSIAALKAYPNGGSYSIAKAALKSLTENLRFELMDKGIKVTGITPGAVWTDSWRESGFEESRMINVKDISELIWTAYHLSASANVEDIIIRPQLGDL